MNALARTGLSEILESSIFEASSSETEVIRISFDRLVQFGAISSDLASTPIDQRLSELLHDAFIPGVPASAWVLNTAQAPEVSFRSLAPGRLFFRAQYAGEFVLLIADDLLDVESVCLNVDLHGEAWDFLRLERDPTTGTIAWSVRQHRSCVIRGAQCVQGSANCLCGWVRASDRNEGEGWVCGCVDR